MKEKITKAQKARRSYDVRKKPLIVQKAVCSSVVRQDLRVPDLKSCYIPYFF